MILLFTACACAEYPKRVTVKHVSGFDANMVQTTGMMESSLRAQRKWREDFDNEKARLMERKEEAASIRKIKDPAEKEARQAEFDRGGIGEGSSQLPNPVLYPTDQTGDNTGIPLFDLVMRVDIQGKFGKEKSIMAFHNSFGR